MDLKNPASSIREQMAIGAMPAVWDVSGIMSPEIRLLASAVFLKTNLSDFLPKIWDQFWKVILRTLRPM